jgi:hypothetical protein
LLAATATPRTMDAATGPPMTPRPTDDYIWALQHGKSRRKGRWSKEEDEEDEKWRKEVEKEKKIYKKEKEAEAARAAGAT